MHVSELVKRFLHPSILPRSLFELFPKGAVTVFNYHEITANPSDFSKQFNLAVHPDTFRRQLSWIGKYYKIVNPKQLVDEVHTSPLALITFDDGFASTFKVGGPILKEMDVPGTVFVNMGPVMGELFWSGLVTYLCTYRQDFRVAMLENYKVDINSLYLFIQDKDIEDYLQNNDEDELPGIIRDYYGEFATVEDLAISSGNNIFLGNHLFNHYNAANISAEKLAYQYNENQSLLKDYSNYINFFSYPYGQPQTCYTKVTDKLISDLGASRIFTAFPLPNKSTSQQKVHRISMFDSVDTEAAFRYRCVTPIINSYIRTKQFEYV